MRIIKQVLEMWSQETKCWQCKKGRFTKPVLLLADNPERNKFQPNINTEVLVHFYTTHGIPKEIMRDWIVGSIYGQELTEFGVRL